MNTLVFLPTQKFSIWSSVSLSIFCGIGIFFSLILLWNAAADWPSASSYKNIIIGLPIAIFMVWLRVQFIGQSTITIDVEKISQRQPVISPSVAWNNIASVQFRESTRMVNGAGAMVRVHRRIAEIKTKNNRQVTFVVSTLSQNDRERVERWLEQAVTSGRAPSELFEK